MNIIVGAIGTNITLGLIQGIAGTTNGIYTMISNIARSTANGSDEIRQVIKTTDLEVKVKTIQYMLQEIKIDEKSSHTLQYCVRSIRDAINEISKELEQIHYRMQYNDNLWVGSTFRSYRFHNSTIRLTAKLHNLESRYNTLLGLLPIKEQIHKNDKLENDQIIAQPADDVLKTSHNLHEKIKLINK